LSSGDSSYRDSSSSSQQATDTIDIERVQTATEERHDIAWCIQDWVRDSTLDTERRDGRACWVSVLTSPAFTTSGSGGPVTWTLALVGEEGSSYRWWARLTAVKCAGPPLVASAQLTFEQDGKTRMQGATDGRLMFGAGKWCRVDLGIGGWSSDRACVLRCQIATALGV